jgi:hypothetical protein
MACRAPFLPDTSLFYQEESQAVFYLQARFKQISTPLANSDFTGRLERSHLVSRSHYSHALRWASGLDPLRIHDRLPGFRDRYRQAHLDDTNSFALPKNRLDNVMDKKVAEQGFDVEPALLQHTKEVIQKFARDNAGRAQDDDYDKDLAEKMIKNVTSVVTNTFYGAWAAPQAPHIVEHEELCEFLMARHASLKDPKVNLDFTTPCCSLCNDIWDCFGRMRQVLTEFDIVPIGSIIVSRRVKDDQRVGNETMLMPIANTSTRSRSFHQQRLGCLVAYYMHGSLMSISRRGVGLDMAAVSPLLRPLISALLWTPLHLTCMYMEMTAPISRPRNGKGQHNYAGCIDLDIAYYLWLLALSDDQLAQDLPFERFSTFYVKELVECPAPVWDAALHPRLLDYVFDGGKPDARDVKESVEYASGRLVLLYTDKIRPLVPLMKGADMDPAAASAEFRARASAYFITGAECARFRVEGGVPGDIRFFIEYAGIAAVLWQMRRYLSFERDAFQQQLDQWLVATMVREWHNIADNSPEEISLLDGQTIYNMQNALAPEALTGPGNPLGSGVEISVLRSLDQDVIMQILAEVGRCSVWKAALRLRAWQFTKEARAAAMAQVGIAGQFNLDSKPHVGIAGQFNLDSKPHVGIAGQFNLDSKPTPARTIVLLDTSDAGAHHLQTHASALRFVADYLLAGARARASFRARLISARLASTPAISTDGCPASLQGAGPGRAARRRGCRGR